MRAHDKPRVRYRVSLRREAAALARHLQKPDRAIPRKTTKNLLVASWNLTNFGLQARKDVHLRLMAEILRPFDVIAIQEVADDITHLHSLLGYLGGAWTALYTDTSGNDERLAMLYDRKRVRPAGLTAELAMRGYGQQTIHVEQVAAKQSAGGFNRNPFMVTFTAGRFEFSLVNVHLYWSNIGVRALETEALCRWAKGRSKKDFPPNEDIILIGDFNMPRVRPGDKLYDIASACGVAFPKHTTDLVGTNLV